MKVADRQGVSIAQQGADDMTILESKMLREHSDIDVIVGLKNRRRERRERHRGKVETFVASQCAPSGTDDGRHATGY